MSTSQALQQANPKRRTVPQRRYLPQHSTPHQDVHLSLCGPPDSGQSELEALLDAFLLSIRAYTHPALNITTTLPSRKGNRARNAHPPLVLHIVP